MSTRRVAMRAHHILDHIVTALRIGVGLLGARRRGSAYLLTNARRARPDRDRRTGRLRAGRAVMAPAQVITFEFGQEWLEVDLLRWPGTIRSLVLYV